MRGGRSTARRHAGVGLPLALAAALLLTPRPAGAQSSVYRNLPDNTWTLLDHGGLSAPSGILAYSGMAYDSDHAKLLVFGGGHCDYNGNEVWSFDIPSATWTRLYAPDPDPATLCPSGYDNVNYPGAVFNPPGEPIADARPLTRHTYDTVEWLGASHELFVTGNYTYASNTGVACYSGATPCYCWNCNDTWTFNPTSNRWTYRNVAHAAQPDGIAAAAYDPTSGLMYVMDRYGIWTYAVATDAWTELSPSGATPTASIELVAEYDSARRVIYRFGGESPTSNELWRYDIGANRWDLLAPSGSAPPALGGWGLAYDSVNDVLVAFRGGAGTWIYNPKTNAWSAANPNTEPPAPNRVHGDMKYDPVNNVALLVTPVSGGAIETWAYRYHSGAPAPPDTIPPNPPAGVTGR
ncbi:MAG: hypothetical protein ACM3JJ_12925 [Hyphomicrobiales bacterium]